MPSEIQERGIQKGYSILISAILIAMDKQSATTAESEKLKK
jgi:hypothetical protein